MGRFALIVSFGDRAIIRGVVVSRLGAGRALEGAFLIRELGLRLPSVVRVYVGWVRLENLSIVRRTKEADGAALEAWKCCAYLYLARSPFLHD